MFGDKKDAFSVSNLNEVDDDLKIKAQKLVVRHYGANYALARQALEILGILKEYRPKPGKGTNGQETNSL
jgi:hypothetical protein